MKTGISLHLFLLLFPPLTAITVHATYETSCMVSSNRRLNPSTTHSRLVLLEERFVANQLMCAHWCIRTSLCLSFNLEKESQLNKGKRRCEILASNKIQRPDLLEEDIDFDHYSLFGNPCGENPCQHEGVCVPDCSAQDYKCTCKPGYTGKDCQKDINECSDYHGCHPTHGYCVNTVGSYNCYCRSGYVGDGRSCTVRECVHYNTLTEPNRNINYSLVGSKCDDRGTLRAGDWYRFTGSAGTRMLDRCPTTKCDTVFQGWLSGGQPDYGQVKVNRTVCWQGNNICCNWPATIKVTHCISFIVYELKPVGGCQLRYCGTF